MFASRAAENLVTREVKNELVITRVFDAPRERVWNQDKYGD